MLDQIRGLHHVTSLASDAQRNNDFFTKILGLRRVKKTVNFDAPDVYHLYYGNETGSPGTVITYFPFPDAAPGRPGTGEAGVTAFAVPGGALEFWGERLSELGVERLRRETRFGEARLLFSGPDGEGLALVEAADDRTPWIAPGIGADHAIRGFHSVSVRLRDTGGMEELLSFMGYEKQDTADGVLRYALPGSPPAGVVDLEAMPNIAHAQQGAGSVHHLAFSVDDRETQVAVRKALMDTGYQVTPVIDRDYFWAIYFRTPGGVLFEIATAEPGFDRDEDATHLGEALKLPRQHEHLRDTLERELQQIDD